MSIRVRHVVVAFLTCAVAGLGALPTASAEEDVQLSVVQGQYTSTYDASGSVSMDQCTGAHVNTLDFSGTAPRQLTANQPSPLAGVADWGQGTVTISGSATAGALSNQVHFGPGEILDGTVPGVMITPFPFAKLTDASLTMTLESDAGRADVSLDLSSRGGFLQCAEWVDADASRGGMGSPSTGWRAQAQGYLTFEALIYPRDTGYGQPIRQTGTGWFGATEGHHTGLIDGVPTSAGVGGLTVLLDSRDAQTSNLDVVAPVVSSTTSRAPNAAGWFNSPVTLTWTALDPAPSAGQPSPSTRETLADIEGRDISYYSPEFCDAAGNCGRGASKLDIDLTPPQLSATGLADGATVVVGSRLPPAQCTATDALSGLAEPCVVTVTPSTADNVVGPRTVTATVADVAGNRSSIESGFSVVYGWEGFAQPVNDTAHQVDQSLSVFKAGSTIPVRFRLLDSNGAVITPLSTPGWLPPLAVGATATPVNESDISTTPTSGIRFEARGDYWQYNWKTDQTQAGSVWRVGALTDDGRSHTVDIALR